MVLSQFNCLRAKDTDIKSLWMSRKRARIAQQWLLSFISYRFFRSLRVLLQIGLCPKAAFQHGFKMTSALPGVPFRCDIWWEKRSYLPLGFFLITEENFPRSSPANFPSKFIWPPQNQFLIRDFQVFLVLIMIYLSLSAKMDICQHRGGSGHCKQ